MTASVGAMWSVSVMSNDLPPDPLAGPDAGIDTPTPVFGRPFAEQLPNRGVQAREPLRVR
jgi:hypothetical protein